MLNEPKYVDALQKQLGVNMIIMNRRDQDAGMAHGEDSKGKGRMVHAPRRE